MDREEYLEWISEGFTLLRKSAFNRCLVTKDCNERPIRAHSVSRSVLMDIQANGHVISPGTKLSTSRSRYPEPALRFLHRGIRQASTGNFACQLHDGIFTPIDDEAMDFGDRKILNLLFYRAVIRELWQLLRVQRAVMWLEERMRLPGPQSAHPENRQKALDDLAARLRLLIDTDNPNNHAVQIEHIVRRFKTDQPVVAASCAGGGSELAFDRVTGRELSQNELHSITRREPNTCWGLTVVPRRYEHVVVASWIKGSLATHYFRHLTEVSGRELQAAVSGDLIYFCENWFLHPTVWKSYGEKKQQAILKAYDNLMELQRGEYKWFDRVNKSWYSYLRIPNRHQLNLFSYRQSTTP